MKNAIELKTETTPVRKLMPERFTRLIAEETGFSISEISTAVNLEKTTSRVWPYIAVLAKDKDPKAFRARLEFIRQRDEAREANKGKNLAA